MFAIPLLASSACPLLIIVNGDFRELLSDAISHTREAGFTRLLLKVRDVNSRAIELYTRQGFVAFGEPVPHPTAGYPMQSYLLELA